MSDRRVFFALAVPGVSVLGAWTRLFGQPRQAPEWTRAVEAYSLGRFDEADRLAADLLVREPAHIDAKRLRGALALWRNDSSAAEVWLRDVVTHPRKDKEAAALLAEALVRQDRFAEAAPFASLAGDRPRARMLESFSGTPPYGVSGTGGTQPLLQVDPFPLVELRINETQTGVFLIDTGGADTIVDTALATRLKLLTFGGERSRLFGGGTSARSERARLAALRIGDLLLRDLPAVVMPISSLLTAADGRPLAGIVGTSVLRRFAPAIDYGRGELTLATASTAKPPCQESVAVPFHLVDDHFIVARGSFGALHGLPFVVDTGLGGAAVAPSERVLSQAGVRLEEATTAVAPGGNISIRPFTVPQLGLGAYVRENARGLAGVFPEELRSALRFDVAGLLGHDFFLGLKVGFDFERMELSLCPSSPRGPAS